MNENDSDAQVNAPADGKSIEIIDQTPEAEDLINGNPVEEHEEVADDEPDDLPEETPTIEEFDKKEEENMSVTVDPDHASVESNEDFFQTTREKLANLRRERNELIVQRDKKEDEYTLKMRAACHSMRIGADFSFEECRPLVDEITDLGRAIKEKNTTISALCKVLQTL